MADAMHRGARGATSMPLMGVEKAQTALALPSRTIWRDARVWCVAEAKRICLTTHSAKGFPYTTASRANSGRRSRDTFARLIFSIDP
jgi:hypothetical protein